MKRPDITNPQALFGASAFFDHACSRPPLRSPSARMALVFAVTSEAPPRRDASPAGPRPDLEPRAFSDRYSRRSVFKCLDRSVSTGEWPISPSGLVHDVSACGRKRCDYRRTRTRRGSRLPGPGFAPPRPRVSLNPCRSRRIRDTGSELQHDLADERV